MDKQLEAQNEVEVTETERVEELTPESLHQVAGGQNGAGTGPPH